MAQPIIFASILSLIIVFSPERQLTAELRSVSHVSVKWYDQATERERVKVFEWPGFLERLRVTAIRRDAVEGHPSCQVRFGDSQWWYLWRRPNSVGDLTDDENGIALDLAPGFVEELLKELSKP